MGMEIGNHTNNSPFTIPKRNTLLLGQKNTGKTFALSRLCLDDIYSGRSVVFLDPTGVGADLILSRIPYERHEDVILIDPATAPFALNLFDTTHEPSLLARAMVDVVKGIAKYDSLATPRMDDFIRTGTLTLLQVPDSSLLSLYYFLTHEKFREECLSHVSDPVLKDIWHYFATLPEKDKRQIIESTINKLKAFLLDTTVRNCIDQRQNLLSIKDKIVIVSLKEGTIGVDNSTFLGLLVLAQLYMDGVNGTETTVYIDGAHRFMSSLLSNVLSVPSLTVVLSMAFLDLVAREWHPVIFGGVGQIVALRCSVSDSERLSPEFELTHNNLERELSQVPPFHGYARVDGTTTEFLLPPLDYPITNNRKRIMARCARAYSARSEILTKRIGRFF